MLGLESKGKVIPREFFGIHINNALPQNKNPYNATECPMFYDQCKYGLIRLWDGYVIHKLVNPSQGVFDWSALDYRINKAVELGIEIMYTFGAMPNWATTQPFGVPNYNPYPPQQMSYLTDFVTAFVQRYRGKVKYYEIWNEVDSDGSWLGTLQQMIDIGTAIYPIIKANDPEAIVLSPNTISWGSLNVLTGLQYQEAYLEQANQFCDAVSMHYYTDPSQPETYIQLGKAYKKLADKYNKPVYCSETGCLSYYDINGVLKKPLTNGVGDMMPENQGASWITRMLICSWLGGVELFSLYKLDNENIMAILLTNYLAGGATATAVYKPMQAFKYTADTLTGGTLYEYKQVGYFHKCKFTTASGAYGDILWMQDYKTSTVDLTQYSSVFDCTGQPIVLVNNYSLATLPIFCFK